MLRQEPRVNLLALVSDDCRAVVGLRQAGGCQSHHPGVETGVGGEEQQGVWLFSQGICSACAWISRVICWRSRFCAVQFLRQAGGAVHVLVKK